MEIVFKSPAQPEKRLLHDALADNRSETLAALLSAICDTIFTTTFLPNKLLLSSLKALEILETRFRLELTNIDFNWSFTLKEQYIIQDASHGLYTKDDIEGAFYMHGGYNGIIALVLYFRESQKIQKYWAAIIEGFREWFVKHVAKMLSRQIIEWIPEFLSKLGPLGPHSLQYIGGHAGRKRKRHTSEAKGTSGVMQARSSPSQSKCATVPQQSQEIHQIGQAVASLPQRAGNPHQQDLQSFQSHQVTPTPISTVSSPEQNLPQQQLDIAGIPHQYIPTPRSNVSSLIAQNPCLPTHRPREDLFAGPLRDTRSSSFQSDSFAATPSTTPSQSIDSTSSIMESQQPTALNHVDYEAIEQPLANAQDPNQLGSIRSETTRSDQELSMGLQLRQKDQQLVPYSAKQATVDKSASLQVSAPRPQLHLSVQRKVPDTAKSIWFATKGDTRALRRLFSEGLASPAEVSNSRELSLLGWALYAGMWNYRTAQFLVMECNAPVDDWSYEHTWEFAYRNCCDSTELKGLQCIMLNPNIFRDWIEEQHFPEVHNIVLGKSSKLLMTELDDNPFAVYATDAKGGTALSWATARAQLDDMKLLIARGSLLDTMDINGRSILLNAVDSSNNEGLRIILEAGANPNPVVPEGLFRSSPLIAAGIGSKLEMIKLLIEFGAEIDATNPEGWTALQAVIKAQNVECANILLTHGADLGYISKNGHSALTTAIIYNSHAVLGLLIDRYDTNHLKGLQLLPIIAGSADAETMSILGASALKRILLNGYDFAASYEILQSRTDYDERLGNAFNEFLSVAGPKRK